MDFMTSVRQTLASTEAFLRAAVGGIAGAAVADTASAENEWNIVDVLRLRACWSRSRARRFLSGASRQSPFDAGHSACRIGSHGCAQRFRQNVLAGIARQLGGIGSGSYRANTADYYGASIQSSDRSRNILRNHCGFRANLSSSVFDSKRGLSQLKRLSQLQPFLHGSSEMCLRWSFDTPALESDGPCVSGVFDCTQECGDVIIPVRK